MATEILNDALFYDRYEIIEGEKILKRSDNVKHNLINGKLIMLIGLPVKENRLGFIFSNLDVHFPDGKNIFNPDFIFISLANGKIVTENKFGTIYGVPDMVVEIFSRSTMKRDIGIKKDVYERNGVKEYWIIDPWRESVEVYLLRDGKYFLDDVYQNYSEAELKELTDEERAKIEFEVPVAVLDGFKVKIKNIFGWFIE